MCVVNTSDQKTDMGKPASNRDKISHSTVVKGLIHQKDITILNVHRTKLMDTNGEREKATIVEDFNVIL